MANSVRHQIMDAVLTALEGITKANGYETNVKLVSEQLEDHEQVPKSDFPALFPIDADESREVVEMPDTSSLDIEAELKVIVTGMVFDRTNKTRQQRTDLLRDVEKAMINDSSLSALILYIEPGEVLTDHGSIPNFSIWDQSYQVTYRYSSVLGG